MFSPEQKKKILDHAMKSVDDWAKYHMADAMPEVHMVSVTVAAQLMCVNARTVKNILPIVAITPSNLRVRMQDIRKFIEDRTSRPRQKRKAS